MQQHDEHREVVGAVRNRVLDAPAQERRGSGGSQSVGVVTLRLDLAVLHIGIRVEGGLGSIKQNSGLVSGNSGGVGDLGKHLHVRLSVLGLGAGRNRAVDLQNGEGSRAVRNTGVEHDTDIEVAALNQAVEVGADGGAAGNGHAVDLDVIGGTVPGHIQRVNLATLRVHLALAVGVALMIERGAVAVRVLLMAPEALAGRLAVAGTAVQRHPAGAPAHGGCTGRQVGVVADGERNPLVSLPVLAPVGEVVNADLHGEAVLHVEGLLGHDGIAGSHIRKAGGRGVEAFGVIVVTAGRAVIVGVIVVIGTAAGRPVAFAGGGGSQRHGGDHGKDHNSAEHQSKQFFHGDSLLSKK